MFHMQVGTLPSALRGQQSIFSEPNSAVHDVAMTFPERSSGTEAALVLQQLGLLDSGLKPSNQP